MAAPPPSTLLGIVPGISSRSAEVEAYHVEFLASAYPQYAAGWLTYAAAHTNLDAGTALQAYVDQLAATGLVTAITVGGKTGASAAAQLATDAGKAAPSAITGVPGGTAIAETYGALDAIPKFLSRLTSGALWLRVAEAAAGLILLAVGVNALFKGRPMNVVTKVAGKAAPLAMM